MRIGSSINMIELNDYEKVELWPYHYFIDKLIYFTGSRRPNIAFVIGQLSRYNIDLRKGYLRAVKKVVQYLKGTIQLSLIYNKGPNKISPRSSSIYGFLGYKVSNFVNKPKD